MRNTAPIKPGKADPPEYDGPSKSMLKRQMTALQKIGQTLADMPFDKLKRSPASEDLLAAIREYQRIRSHEGRRRQLQYIGKVMRNENGDLLAQWIAGESLDQRLEVTRMHAAEAWRDRLLEEPALLAEFIHNYPAAQGTDLHTLIRNARAEKDKNKPPKSARELYKLIKGWVSVQSGQSDVDALADEPLPPGDESEE
jgi:ribosome-associated protein